MSFEIVYTDAFAIEVKKLSKKYRSLKDDLEKLITELEVNPSLGTPIGKNCYKIRLAIGSKGKGKSSGARVITHIHIVQNVVYLLSIYDKSEKECIPDKEILELLKNIRE